MVVVVLSLLRRFDLRQTAANSVENVTEFHGKQKQHAQEVIRRLGTHAKELEKKGARTQRSASSWNGHAQHR